MNEMPNMNIDWNTKLDNKIDSAISSLVKIAESTNSQYGYTREDLSKKVNDDETLEEYIRDTEETFNLARKELEALSDFELNEYVKFLDGLW